MPGAFIIQHYLWLACELTLHLAVKTGNTLRQKRKPGLRKPRTNHHRRNKKRNEGKATLLSPKLWVE